MVSLVLGERILLFKLSLFMSSHSFQLLLVCLIAMPFVRGQSNHSQTMDFEKYDPVSTLVVPEHKLTRAKFPFIDVHNHQWNVPNQNIPELFSEMDSLDMKVMVNLSGKGYRQSSGVNGDFDVNDHSYLVRSFENIKKTDARRLVLFTNISFVGFGQPGWTEKTVRELESDVK